MAYKQIFNKTVPYRLPDDLTLVNQFGGQPNPPPYSSLFTTPPRIYGEEFRWVSTLFVRKEPTPSSTFVIIMNVTTFNIYGYWYGSIKLDGNTGGVLSYGAPISTSLAPEIVQSTDGTLWDSYSGNLRELDPVTYAVINTTLATFFEIPADQLFHGVAHPMVDKVRNIVVMAGYPASTDARYILVNTLSTGALLRRIHVSGPVSQIMQEDDRRCFVICTNGIINIVDYTTGQVLSATRGPVRTPGSLYAWDFILRRLLIFNHRDALVNFYQTGPINPDGSSPNTIEGYYPVPIATNITKAIPLKPPRKYRTVNVFCRVVGDAGEPMPGVAVTATASGAAASILASGSTNNYGEAIFPLTGLLAGSSTVNFSAVV